MEQGSQLIAKARRAAKRHHLKMKKSRAPLCIENVGEFRLIDAHCNCVVAGERFNLTAQDIIDYCEELDEQKVASNHIPLGR